MLQVQNYLQTKSLKDLETELGIKNSRHTKYNNLVLLKYDQIKSPTYHPIVKECRGIILDEGNNWEIVSYPFSRFYNYGQNESEKAIDWSTATVQEKLDGSLIQLFYYESEWLVATTGKADASGIVNGFDFTFADLFWKIFNQLNYKLPNPELNLTYLFELCTIYNKVVVEYKEPKLVLLGVRSLITNKEYGLTNTVRNDFNWEIVKQFKLNTIEDILNYLKTTKGNELEGLVVVDKYFNRIKVKSEEYVSLHHIRSNVNTPYALLEVIRKNETEELLVYFKELTEEINNLDSKYKLFIKLVTDKWLSTKYINDRKEFALTIKDYYYSDCLFSLYLNKVSSVEEYLNNLDVRKVYQWIQEICP